MIGKPAKRLPLAPRIFIHQGFWIYQAGTTYFGPSWLSITLRHSFLSYLLSDLNGITCHFLRCSRRITLKFYANKENFISAGHGPYSSLLFICMLHHFGLCENIYLISIKKRAKTEGYRIEKGKERSVKPFNRL